MDALRKSTPGAREEACVEGEAKYARPASGSQGSASLNEVIPCAWRVRRTWVSVSASG